MDRLWTPWRYNYITKAETSGRPGVPEALSDWPEEDGQACVFCNMVGAVAWAIGIGVPMEEAEKAAYIVERGETCFVCLNAYPYSTGHVLVVPYFHTNSLAKLDAAVAAEMMGTAQRVERWLHAAYRPDGMNMGLNLGEAAGAGVANHLHLHALPRWSGDTNFMTVVAETRILPERLEVTWQKLREQVTFGQPKSP